MAHNLDFSRGTAAIAYRGETPWHGLGKQLTTNSTAEWAREAGLDWQVTCHPGYAMTMREVPDGFGGINVVPQYDVVDDLQIFRRSDNNAILCSVGPTMTPLQNSECFAFFQPFLDAGLADLETAMALDAGRRIVVTAALKNGVREIVKGDDVKRYLTLAHGHDGSLAVHVGLTPVRIVCQNTLSAALSNKRSQLIRVRHGRNVARDVMELRETIDAVNACFDATEEQYRALAGRKNINERDLRKYVKVVFGMEAKADGSLATRTQNTLDDILAKYDRNAACVREIIEAGETRREIEREAQSMIGSSLLDMVLNNMEAGKGAEIPEQKGSWWNAYNAVTEYLTHNRGRTAESRVNSNLFGANAETNRIAFQTAMQMSGLQSA